MHTKSLLVLFVLVAVLAITLTSVSDHAYAHNKNPRIIPPNANFRGKSYGEWAASWWQVLFAVPVVSGSHPYLNGGPFQGENGVVYLAAVASAPVTPVTIDVTIPAGTPLFVPIINAECSVFEPDPFHGVDEESLRTCANGHIDQTSGVSAKLDGKKVQDLEKYRVESPLFTYVLPESNLFAFFGLDAPAGTTSDAVDAGYYLLLAPLSVGEHKLRIRATFDEFGTFIDTTYNITVQPRRCHRTGGADAPCAPMD